MHVSFIYIYVLGTVLFLS